MILSTRKLTVSQKQLFINANMNLVDYDAIEITLIDFEAPKQIENSIFTSQNSVKSFFSHHNLCASELENIFCVGKKTQSILLENGQKVIKTEKNGEKLANFIIKTYKTEDFYYLCGNLRRDEIPTMLKKAEINCFEVKTYKTDLNSMNNEQKWTGILFFSPSGIQSFIEGWKPVKNDIKEVFLTTIAFCIGETTAIEAKKYFHKIEVASQTTVESVIEKTISTIKKI